MKALVLLFAIVIAGPAAAQSWSEPARGTVTRSALMDALRPHAEWLLGAPVQFVVHDLRVAGHFAFAAISAQRPGGGAIDLRATPGFARADIDPDFLDGATMQALYRKSGATWVAVHWALGATDVWYSYAPFCAEYRVVIPEVC